MVDPRVIVGGVIAILGALLVILGAIGVMRFPDVYTRIHAASITDTGGATLVILGLGIVSGASMVTLKLVILWVFIMLTSPTAAHALANAAFSAGHAPWIGTFRIMREGDPPPKTKRSRKEPPPPEEQAP